MNVSSLWRKPLQYKSRVSHPGVLGLTVLLLVGCSATSQAQNPDSSMNMAARGEASGGPAIAVVELFTSEGCSSSPPAEAQLRRVVAQERASGRRVYPLEFHVTYWNDLGWVDPFSKKSYTNRQWEYAHTGNRDHVATPQMIVNGRSVFTGSRASAVDRHIDAGLSEPAPAAVSVSLGDANSAQSDAGPLTVNYQVKGLDQPAVLRLALVERGLVSRITRGENAGRTLRHANVVREFKSVRIDPNDANGTTTLPVPADVDRANATVIAYAQDPDRMGVLGAGAVDVRVEKN